MTDGWATECWRGSCCWKGFLIRGVSERKQKGAWLLQCCIQSRRCDNVEKFITRSKIIHHFWLCIFDKHQKERIKIQFSRLLKIISWAFSSDISSLIFTAIKRDVLCPYWAFQMAVLEGLKYMNLFVFTDHKPNTSFSYIRTLNSGLSRHTNSLLSIMQWRSVVYRSRLSQNI